MIFTLLFNIAVSSMFFFQRWQWQSVGYDPVKDVKFCFRTSTLSWRPNIWSSVSALSWLLKMCSSVPHFRLALTVKDLKFSFRTSALPWLANVWSFALRTLLCQDFRRSQVPLPNLFCQDFQQVKFRFCMSSLPGPPKMWSFAYVLPFCLDCQRSEVGRLH